MTTGTKTYGGFATVSCKFGSTTGVAQVGEKVTKMWSGSNGRTGSNASYHVRPGTQKTRVFLEPQPYEMTKETDGRGLFRVKAKPTSDVYVPGDGILETTITGFVSVRPTVPVDQRYKLLAKIHEKVFGSGFNPLVFAAEGREALDMIWDATVRLGAAYHAVRTRDWRLLRKSLNLTPREAKRVSTLKKNVSGRWLEVNYGWIPLLSDVEDGAKFIAQAMLERSPSSVVKVRLQPTRRTDVRTIWSSEWAGYTRTLWTTRLQAVVYVTQPPTYRPTIYSLASVVWEKTPWSFVVDWFVPIGDYISALETASKVDGKLVVTELTTGEATEPRPNPIQCDKSFIGYDSYLNSRFAQVYMKREVYPSLNAYIRPPLSLEWGLSNWRRTANAVALASQANWSGLAKIFNDHRR